MARKTWQKIAVVGDRESVLGFRALGLEVCTPEGPDEIRKAIDRLAADCAVIYLSERMAQQVPETVNRYKQALTPAIIPIPDSQGSLGLGEAAVFERVEKAVGSNIFEE
jgi:V/A-type H+-transporting ATPase subunit F